MVGTCSGVAGEIFTIQELQWLYETLEANRNKRCFVFQHVFPWGDSGNANNAYAYGDLFAGTRGDVFKALLRHYKNTVFFHGHSHLKFELQAEDSKANYSEAFGYRSVHIPSLSVPRDIIGGSLTDIYADSEGYVVDVYENGIHLRGRDFIKKEFLPIASYWIDTTLQTVTAGTFTEPSGLIVTGTYRQLDYIETTGTQYVDTGFTPNQDSRAIVEFLRTGGRDIYGSRSSTSSRQFSLRVISNVWQPGYGSNLGSTDMAADTGIWHTADQNKNVFSIDGATAKEFEYTEFTTPTTFILGGINAYNGGIYEGTARFRSCRLYDNGTLVRNLVAARIRDGSVGMYDTLNNVFYGNYGDGELIAGAGI